MHIDVNNAFLSWTAASYLKQGLKYDIREGYTVIGKGKKRGVVLARSELSKRVGIKTGEPLYKAHKKCLVLRVYPPNYKLYEKMSKDLYLYLKKYTPDIEKMSIDECFLDYTKIKHLYGNEIKFAHKLKNSIKKDLGWTVNIGIGNNKLLAKTASDFKKPNKVHTLYTNEIESKLWPLPVSKLFGVGKKTTEKLLKLNIKTIYDLAHIDQNKLSKYFKNQALKLIESANGIDDSEVISESISPKGIGSSITLNYDYTKKTDLYNIINSLVEKVAHQLRKQNKYANVVVITIRNNKFITKSHQIKLKNATNDTLEIKKTAKSLFDKLWDKTPVRLIGVRLEKLVDQVSYQISLFEEINEIEKNFKLTKVIDNINTKYGYKTIKTGLNKENKHGNNKKNK